MSRILCVAEKPAIAKAVAQHLSGGSFQTVSIKPHGKDLSRRHVLTHTGLNSRESICQELPL